MKKGLLYIVALIGCIGLFSGCMKSGSSNTIKSAMTTTIGAYTFNATTVTPGTVKPQLNDSATALVITGFDAVTGAKIILTVTKFKGIDGTFSIVEGQAGAVYYHDGVYDIATGGIVAINTVSNVVIGYFNYTTPDGLNAVNGTFTVGNPWVY